MTTITQTKKRRMHMKKVVLFTVLLSGLAFAAPERDTLSTPEVHELQLIAMKGAELQKAIDEYQAERTEVINRLKKAHAMTDEDDFDINNKKVARGVHKKEKQPEPPKKTK